LLIQRYGIKAAYSKPFACTYFQGSVEALDKYTKDFKDIPMRAYSGHGTTERKGRPFDINAVDPEFDLIDSIYDDDDGGDLDDLQDDIDNGTGYQSGEERIASQEESDRGENECASEDDHDAGSASEDD
jgi:hypothetical protein